MGYSWTSINKGDKILADHWNEVKTNLDDLYNDLQLSQYSWVNFPVASGQIIKYDHLSELRDATDYADDMNYCREHDASQDITINNDEHTGYYSGEDSPYYNNEHYTYKNNYHSGYNSGVNSAQDNPYNSTYNNDEHSTYKSSDYPSVLIGDDNGYHDIDHVGDMGNYDSIIRSPHNYNA